MTRESRLWLAAAVVVAVVVAAVVLVFGYNRPPAFASLYAEGAPTLSGSVAHLEFGREDCVWILDVASGEDRELYCDNWVWAESWDEDGNLLVHAGNGHEQVWVVDPETGAVLSSIEVRDGPFEEDEGGPPPEEEQPLRARSTDGRVTLTHGTGEGAVTLIDVEAPRNYGFTRYETTADGEYVWVGDSEDRLLVVALDGQSGPWLVAEGINDPLWN